MRPRSIELPRGARDASASQNPKSTGPEGDASPATAGMDSGNGTLGSEPQERRSWADVPSDILGIVVGCLPCVDDRASLRSVCGAWRAAGRLHRPPPPPLPLLVLSNFASSSFSPDGAMRATRHIPLPKEVSAHDARCVGSYEGWLVGVRPNKGRYFGDGKCFLMNPFSGRVIHLPPPSASTHFIDAYSRSFPIIGGCGSGVVECTIHAAQYVMSFCKVILSSSPDSVSKCIVAAISVHRNGAKLALSRPGMRSWCVCLGGCISKFSDINFYQGKLYMVSKLTTNLFAFEITDDDCGLMVSRVERCVADLPEVKNCYGQRWNMVEWHGKLLLVVRNLGGGESWQNFCRVGVFVLDLSTKPFGFTEINTLDGDCIFISTCSSKSIRVCQYEGVEDDIIYFFDGYLYPAKNSPPFDKFMYNLRGGTMAPFAADVSEYNFRARDDKPMSPTWLFPSE